MSTFDYLSTLPADVLIQLGIDVIVFLIAGFVAGFEIGRRIMWKYHLYWVAERRRLLGLED